VTAPRAIREFPYTGDPWPVIEAWATHGRYRSTEERPGVRALERKRWWSMTRHLLVISSHDLLHIEARLAPSSWARGSSPYGMTVPDEITVEPGGLMASGPRKNARKEINRLLSNLGAPSITEAIDPDGRIWESLQIRIADAGDLTDAGRLDESRELWYEILPIAERLFGTLHGVTLTGRLDLALVELEAGNMEQALAGLQQVVPDLERVVGPDAPWTLNAKESLAVALAATGREAEAKDLAARTVDDFARVLGPTHPRAQKAKRNFHRRDWSTGALPSA
jgi:hypothetical protein